MASAVAGCDREKLAADARYKQIVGESLTTAERKALDVTEEEYLAHYGDLFCRTLTKQKFAEWSGIKHESQLYQLADRYGAPLRGKGISLPDFVRWAISYVTEQGKRRNGTIQTDDDPDLEVAEGGSVNLERYRFYKAEHAKTDLEKKHGELVSRTDVIDMHSRWSRVFRSMCERVEKRFGTEAYNLVTDALDECEQIVRQFTANDSE